MIPDPPPISFTTLSKKKKEENKTKQKNPANGRHRISRPMLIEAPIQKEAYKATVQCSAVQCRTVHCTALHCIALHYTALHCTALHWTALQRTALHCTVALYASFCIGASISIGREIRCLPYAGFFIVFSSSLFLLFTRHFELSLLCTPKWCEFDFSSKLQLPKMPGKL